MKTNISSFKAGLALIVMLTMTQAASAFYDANLGRWLSRDPLSENGGFNLYGFVYGNPVNVIDPDGRNPAGVVGGGLVGGGGTTGLLALRACLMSAACRQALINAGLGLGALIGIKACKPPLPDETCNCFCPSGAYVSYKVPAGAPCRPVQNAILDWQSGPDGTPVQVIVGYETCPCAK